MAQIKITADASQAEREIKRLEKALDNLDSFTSGVAKGLAAITAAAGAMGYAIAKTLDSAGELIDSAKAIGISAQSLQLFQKAAALSGVAADQLTASLIKMSANIGDAMAKGTGPATDALKKLKIPMDELAVLKPDEQFKRITTELNAMTNPAERNALAMDLFGKSGPRILQVAQNLEAARKSMEDMGLALTDMDLAALDMAGDKVDELKGIFDAGLKKAVADIAPYIIAMVNKIKEAIVEAGGFEAIWQKIKEAIKTALNVAAMTAVVFALAKMVQGAVALTVAIRSAGVAMGLFNTLVMRNPLMLAVGAALLLAKVLGVDVVGFVTEQLGLTEKIAEANGQIAEEAKNISEENARQVEYQKQITAEQQKALDALDGVIKKYETQAAYQRDIITYGEEEAAIRKVLTEEADKLTKVGLTLNEQQAQRLRNAMQEELAVKRIVDQRKQVKDLFTDWEKQGGASADVLAAREKYYEAIKTLELANTEESKKQAQGQLNIFKASYQEKILLYAQSLSEIGRLEQDYNTKLGQLTTAANDLRKLGFTEENDLLRQLNEEKLKIEAEYQTKRDQLAMEGIQRRLMAEKSAFAQSLSDQDAATLQRIGAEERQKAIVDERIKFEKKSELEKTTFALDNMQTVFAALGAQNKKAFEASKALAIASALVNTYQGATKALATYPFPFGLIAAAAAVAAGMAQVAAIRSQQYSGRALGGPVMGGQSYIVGESGPELFTPANTGRITRNGDLGGGGGPVNVQFTIVANDTQGFDQLLTSRKGVITQIISDAMLERGQRSSM